LSQDRTWTPTSTGCPKTGPGLQHQQVVPRQDLDSNINRLSQDRAWTPTSTNKANDNLSPQAIKHKKNTPHGVGNPDPVLGQPVDVGVQALSWDNLLMLESRSCLGTTC
jgi:hypothetical protein